LGALAEKNSKQVSIRLTTVELPFSILKVKSSSGVDSAQIELYGYRITARDRPVISVTRVREPRTYELFSGQYEAIWDVAKPFER